jgi:hypothetical protein
LPWERVPRMTQEEIEQSSQEVRALYQPYLTGPASRIARGGELMQQFEAAVQICHADPRSDERSLTERVNEMAVAKQLADDPHLLGLITYEPNFLPDGRRIDFVAERPDDNLYVEVKTVHPRTDDSEAAWQRYVRLRAHQPANVHVVLDREWMGAALYGFKFASRSHFLDYTLFSKRALQRQKHKSKAPAFWFSVATVSRGTGRTWRISPTFIISEGTGKTMPLRLWSNTTSRLGDAKSVEM